MADATLVNGVLRFTSGGIKGNLPHLPGQKTRRKREREVPNLALVTKRLATEAGIASKLGKRRGMEQDYAVGHKLAGSQKLRGKYRP